jgi:tetratricopeptide (TPR) repeat protein
MNRRWLIAAVAAAGVGCTGTSPKELWREKAGPKKVTFDGAGVALGELGKPSVTTDAFVRRTAELMQARRALSAQRYIERYPDVAVEALRVPPPGAPGEVMAYITKTLGDRSQSAAAEKLLQDSEALRRDGKYADASQAWTKAAIASSELLQARPTWTDPSLWERLASLRTNESKWPESVREKLAARPSALGLSNTGSVPAECLLWAMIGRWHMDRLEAHAAIATFKRAETFSSDAVVSQTLQIWQAQALVPIGQETTAVSILMPLTTDANPVVAGPALATLGSVKLQGGAAKQAQPILEKAIALPPVWFGRPEALGDLAIALLILGDEPNGVECLHAAENAFQSIGDYRGMLRAMNNEAEYWAAKDAQPRSAQVREHMAGMECSAANNDAAPQSANMGVSRNKSSIVPTAFQWRK